MFNSAQLRTTLLLRTLTLIFPSVLSSVSSAVSTQKVMFEGANFFYKYRPPTFLGLPWWLISLPSSLLRESIAVWRITWQQVRVENILDSLPQRMESSDWRWAKHPPSWCKMSWAELKRQRWTWWPAPENERMMPWLELNKHSFTSMTVRLTDTTASKKKDLK